MRGFPRIYRHSSTVLVVNAFSRCHSGTRVPRIPGASLIEKFAKTHSKCSRRLVVRETSLKIGDYRSLFGVEARDSAHQIDIGTVGSLLRNEVFAQLSGGESTWFAFQAKSAVLSDREQPRIK